MLVKIEARILIFPSTDFHFPSTSVSPGTFLGWGNWGSAVSSPSGVWGVAQAELEFGSFHPLNVTSGGNNFPDNQLLAECANRKTLFLDNAVSTAFN